MSKLLLHPRYVTDASGRRTLALLDIAEFERLRDGLRDQIAVVDTPADDCADLLHAAGTSLDFWDNPEDAAAWNNYPPM